MRTIVFFIITFFAFISCSEKKVVLEKTPDAIYRDANGALESPLGKWRYKNTYFIEFEGEPNRGKWSVSTDYGQGEKVVFTGKWYVYNWDKNKGIGYLRLDYENIGLTNPLKIDSKTNRPEHIFYPYRRYQILEYYCDSKYFGMNIYKKRDSQSTLEGEWEHANYDWFDDFYVFSESPLWIDENSFNEKVLKYLDDSEKKFIEKIYTYNLAKYYRKQELTGEEEFELNKIMAKVREKKGYSGEWFYVSLSSIPKYNTYYVNRRGILELDKYGQVRYKQETPFFGSIVNNELINGLPTLEKDRFGNIKVTAKYIIWDNYVYNNNGGIAEKEVNIKIFDSSNDLVMSNWEFKVIIIKDYNILITFPFERVLK
ncbi:MAG TPA: hypothetical protein PKW55_04530 [Spirochaetota bacterium]|nr:hypothetical protein [Spirochaetota bacterium]HOM37896.1 hypothetical protein [Spirochaetota bacterium]HPQ48700.1 hypothetical protein [Spirochaetota bacterium]